MPKSSKKSYLHPSEISKTQAVRVADVLLVGPLMGLGGAALRQTNRTLGNTLIGISFLTLVYNARNFTKANEAMRKMRSRKSSKGDGT